jgi:endonuclease YncB( thermonuclease family)
VEKAKGDAQVEGGEMTILNLYLRIILILLVFPTVSFAGQFRVTRVTDGDTIKISRDGTTITVRLVGIDAPETSKRKNEPGQPFSRKATKHFASLVLNKSVTVESSGTDRYGRTLGVVFVNGKNVNLEMVKVGLAEVYRGKPAKGLDINIYRYNVRDARDRRKKRTFYQPSTKSSCISGSIRGIDDQKQKRLIISRRHTYNRQLNLIGGR